MSEKTAWTPRIEGADGPIYLAIADAVAAGELRPGDRLPTHRTLAEALGIDLTTATRAYAEARRRGLLRAVVGRGTFVRAAASTPAVQAADERDGPVDLGMNLPPRLADPSLGEVIQQGVARLLARPGAAELLTYRSGPGTAEERAAGAAWLRPVLGEVEPGRVLLCPGAQCALHAVLTTLTEAGDVVLTAALAR